MEKGVWVQFLCYWNSQTFSLFIFFLPTYLFLKYASTCQNNNDQLALNKLTSYFLISLIFSSSTESIQKEGAVLLVCLFGFVFSLVFWGVFGWGTFVCFVGGVFLVCGFFFFFILKEKPFKLALQTRSRAGLWAGLLSSLWSPPWWISLFHCSGIGSVRSWICGTGPLKKAYDTNRLSPNSASVCLPSDNWGEEKPNPQDTHLVHDWRIYDRMQFPPFVWQRAAGLCNCVSAFLLATASSWIGRTGNDLAKGFWWQLTEFLLITFWGFFCPVP